MYSIIRLTDRVAANYLHLTFPHLRHLLKDIDRDSSIIALGATCGDEPVGLAIAEIWQNSHEQYSAEIVSILVADAHQNAGIGTALLNVLEEALYRRACCDAILVYPAGKPTTPALERLLQKYRWTPPQPRMLVCQTTMAQIAKAPWLDTCKLPDSFEVFPWGELTPEERSQIQQRYKAQKWYPQALSPFQEEAYIEPINSLGLRYDGEVVGWTISHRYLPDTLRYTALFVRQDLQRMGRAIALLSKAIRLQHDHKIPNAIFTVECDNAPMCSFTKRRMASYMNTMTETRGSTKRLMEDKTSVSAQVA
jgi:GNAT superfamily N-acetyltransferase